MKNIRLFIDSDTCLLFESRTKALIYAAKIGCSSFCVYSEESRQVFNPWIQDTNCVQTFKTEREALQYIGQVLS